MGKENVFTPLLHVCSQVNPYFSHEYSTLMKRLKKIPTARVSVKEQHVDLD